MTASCANTDHDTRAVRAVAKLSFPDGRYKPTTACAGCLLWQVREARHGVYPITIEPLAGTR